ncbi:MAG: MetQ/NlpA family ABC transporter substrate-binding protein [Deltaproteobacteria bacterium]|jgi:D-methionine transport system substrate-binding protein|nr:MetQ/NlpA family ABC transporter substrate-binding protein [Deltaproteobacteria bacterium]
MKRLLIALLFIFAASPALAAERLVVGVTPFPHKSIMQAAAALLAKEGYILELVEFTDYVQPNMALEEKRLFANFFQHIPYMENMNAEKGLGLAWIAKVHLEPLGMYSKKIKNISQLKKGDMISVPNDPTNEARALRLLEANKLIILRAGELVTIKDILDNPRGLLFKEIDAPQLPRTLQDVTASVINTNFAGEAGLTPSKDALIIEGKDSPYANVIVVRSADKNSPAAKALIKAVQSSVVKKYIENVLAHRGIVPAF